MKISLWYGLPFHLRSFEFLLPLPIEIKTLCAEYFTSILIIIAHRLFPTYHTLKSKYRHAFHAVHFIRLPCLDSPAYIWFSPRELISFDHQNYEAYALADSV